MTNMTKTAASLGRRSAHVKALISASRARRVRALRAGLVPLLFACLLVDPVGHAAAQAPPVGIGVQVEPATGGPRIVAVTPGSPAERAGLHAGDRIVEVDGVSIVKLDLSAVAAKVRGAQGTTVRLTVLSPAGQRRQVQIVRALPTPKAPAGANPISSGPNQATPTSQAAGPGIGDVKFVNWVEPKEHSFSVGVPAGWQLDGGLNWLSQIDPQGYVRVQSPDGKLQIFMGDPELLGRQVPNGYSRLQTGAAEGQVFRTPAGGPAKMQRFLTGTQYAKEHVTWRLCPNPTWVAERELPDVSRALTAAVEPEARKYNATVTASAGETSFTCGNIQGAVFAATVLGSSRGGPVQAWFVYKLAGFRSADPLRSMQARYIMEHMLATVTPNQAWTDALDRRTLQVTGAVISMQNAATQAHLAASRRQNDTLARLNHPNPGVNVRPGERRPTSVNSILGTKDVCDAIGRCKTVSTDSESAFMDHSGNVREGRAGGAPPDNSGVWSPTFVR